MVYRSPEILTRHYKSLVRPHLEYCVLAWSPHYVKDQERLERVQHRFMRMVPGLRGLEYGERLERLKMVTLEERRNRCPPRRAPLASNQEKDRLQDRPYGPSLLGWCCTGIPDGTVPSCWLSRRSTMSSVGFSW